MSLISSTYILAGSPDTELIFFHLKWKVLDKNILVLIKSESGNIVYLFSITDVFDVSLDTESICFYFNQKVSIVSLHY